MERDLVRCRLVIHGRVQGVFFRKSLRDFAQDRGVSGWALNRRDGAVEAAVEGRRPAVAEVVGFCETGPPEAWVERVDVDEEPVEGLSGFRIR
jgi:acylphosphatase